MNAETRTARARTLGSDTTVTTRTTQHIIRNSEHTDFAPHHHVDTSEEDGFRVVCLVAIRIGSGVGVVGCANEHDPAEPRGRPFSLERNASSAEDDGDEVHRGKR